jgi:hypothetical protein
MVDLVSLPKVTFTVVPACLVSEKKEDEDIVNDGLRKMNNSKMRNILCGGHGCKFQKKNTISKKIAP